MTPARSRGYALPLAALLAACAPEATPTERVRAAIAAAERAAEQRDVGAAMALVAADYADSHGFDRAQLRRFLQAYFLAHPSVNLLVRVEDLQFPAARLATATVTVGSLNRRSAEDWALAVNLRTFAVELVEEQGEWRLRRADELR
ncbi:MAG: hypothetical protein NZM12_08985 [Steroidobacteraceae bacterium]|nr:hypothetical protein [Steroidobacteraceae bacterium]MDW8258461.1 hypothetical protein [Gammaproteobacteria bacterium]